MRKGKTMKISKHKGGCLCGFIRFEATGIPGEPHTCSCTMCQRHTGALTVTWVEYPKSSILWIGPGGPPATYRSSEFSSRAFCPKCGSSLGALDINPVVALLVGTFDRPGSKDLKPVSHSYKGKRPKWWHIEIAEE